MQIAREQRAHFRGIVGREQGSTDVGRADCTGLLFPEVFALVVSIERHRKGEPDDEPEQGERGSLSHSPAVARVVRREAKRSRRYVSCALY